MSGIVPEELDLIAAKFLLNLPYEQLSEDRIGLHFEKAYFYYLDTREPNSQEKKKSQAMLPTHFYTDLLRVVSCPQLPKLSGPQIVDLVEQNYNSIPVNGIILLNMEQTRALLVQSRAREIYGFPKGKVNEGQSAEKCAVREVQQQIGLKVEVDPNNYVEVEIYTPTKYNSKQMGKCCRFFITKIEESCVVPRKCSKSDPRETGIRDILHSSSEIISVDWYRIKEEIPKLIDQNLLNKPSRFAYVELVKKLGKNLNYREKKSSNPLAEFKSFDSSLGNVFLK